MDTARTLTISEAAEACGLTRKAVRNRVDRGTLPHTLRDGRRRIPASELVRAGLLGVNGEAGAEVEKRQRPHGGNPGVDVAGLIGRIEEQATELGRLRALQQVAETTSRQAEERADRLEEELLAARASLTELEAKLATLQRRRFFSRRRRDA